MHKQFFALFLSLLFVANLSAQDSEEIIFSVGEENVTRTEFKYIYEKNNSISKDEKLYTKESLEEYLELYVKFKLKVHEAKAQGLDTTEKFLKEFMTYRSQLAEPYLRDKNVSEALIKEAYDRKKSVLRASHILIDLDEGALPGDTLKAYDVALKAKKEAMHAKDFAAIARKYASFTKDPTLEKSGGDLGYFGVFNMIYPFESAAYNAKVGDIVGPVRTKFGYHIIKLTERKPYEGEITAAHIMIRTDLAVNDVNKDLMRRKIDSIYGRLKKGEPFENLARTESQHSSTASNGGRLKKFDRLSNWLPADIVHHAFKLEKDGEFSEPFQSEYGWHIVKRIELITLPEFDKMKEYFRSKVERDSRSQRSVNSAVRRIKKENRFSENLNTLNAFKTKKDQSIINGGWNKDSEKKYDEVMFTIGKKKYTQLDFCSFLENGQGVNQFTNAEFAMDYYYEKFVEKSVFDFEDAQLENKHEDFRNIVREYYEGILLFEVTDKEVWSKAMKDSVGQRNYYEAHLGKYQWNDRVNATIFYCKDKSVAKKIKKGLNKDNSNLQELYKEMNSENSMNFSFIEDTYEKGSEEVLDMVKWKKGYRKVESYKDRYVLIKVNKVMPAGPKKLKEIKGMVIADYQAQLEKKWLEMLNNKFQVEINKEAVNNLVK